MTKRGSFSYVYRKGNVCRARHMTLLYVQGRDVPRIGISVSNKVGHAVIRNKLKRRIRSVLSETVDNLLPCQAVLTVKPAAGGLDYETVREEVLALLVKSELLKSDEKKEENSALDNY